MLLALEIIVTECVRFSRCIKYKMLFDTMTVSKKVLYFDTEGVVCTTLVLALCHEFVMYMCSHHMSGDLGALV